MAARDQKVKGQGRQVLQGRTQNAL